MGKAFLRLVVLWSSSEKPFDRWSKNRQCDSFNLVCVHVPAAHKRDDRPLEINDGRSAATLEGGMSGVFNGEFEDMVRPFRSVEGETWIRAVIDNESIQVHDEVGFHLARECIDAVCLRTLRQIRREDGASRPERL